MSSVASRQRAPVAGAILLLAQACPWKDHLYALEAERGLPGGQVKFVLYCDDREKTWRVQGVNTAPGSFALRCGLPAAWRGLRGDALSAAAGIAGCVFVHAGGFIGGNATQEGALAMAAVGVAEGST